MDASAGDGGDSADGGGVTVPQRGSGERSAAGMERSPNGASGQRSTPVSEETTQVASRENPQPAEMARPDTSTFDGGSTRSAGAGADGGPDPTAVSDGSLRSSEVEATTSTGGGS